ncbi:MAG: hypothetical protein HY811_11455 [Planctomycetes bacterium]|nr:hypothetical protein [Planctomycetota bacterium]
MIKGLKIAMVALAIAGLILIWAHDSVAQGNQKRQEPPVGYDEIMEPDNMFEMEFEEGELGEGEDNPPMPSAEDKNRGERNKGERFRGQHQPMQGGPDIFMQNLKVQEEMKRHGEAMKPLFEEMKVLREKMRKELKPKDGETKPPKEQPGKDAPKPDDKMREDMEKLMDPYKAEAEKIAGKITAEMVLHHQNLAKIVEAEKENITKKIAKDILMPPPPGQRGNMGGHQENNRGGMRRGGNQNDNQKPPMPPEEKEE